MRIKLKVGIKSMEVKISFIKVSGPLSTCAHDQADIIIPEAEMRTANLGEVHAN